MIVYRVAMDVRLEVNGTEDVTAACQAIADHFQSIADGTSGAASLFDTGAHTSIAPDDDSGWVGYAEGCWP